MLAKTRTEPNWSATMSELDRMTRKLRDEREAREQAAELRQITARVIERPIYNNRNVDNFRQWVADNANALADWWRACGVACDTPADDGEFNLFVLCQYDAQRLANEQREATYTEHQRYVQRMNAVMVDSETGIRAYGEI